jgi:hypothetical protein
MNIPLDNLYHWIEGMLPAPAVIYLFYPHGAKNISDLSVVKTYLDYSPYWFNIPVIAHDQEPLDFAYYEKLSVDQIIKNHLPLNSNQSTEYLQYLGEFCSDKNLASVPYFFGTLYEQTILIHSEKNSSDVEKYQQANFLPVYYWAHAIIARDWYRFAPTDPRLNQPSSKQKTFLIYCRDWSHRREYRLKFVEMLVENNLQETSQISISKICGEGYHYTQHEFVNADFELKNSMTLDLIPDNQVDSNESARYCPDDINRTKISIVLETVFDDQRIHLTEKIFRPIACGHPFLLAAGPGSLEYLRSYGFETFDPWIDESYDKEINGFLRLKKIIQSMHKLIEINDYEYSQIKRIAEFNRKHFFSDDFQQQITNELKFNLNTTFKKVKRPRGKTWRLWRQYLRRYNSKLFDTVQVTNIETNRKKFHWLRSQRQT